MFALKDRKVAIPGAQGVMGTAVLFACASVAVRIAYLIANRNAK